MSGQLIQGNILSMLVKIYWLVQMTGTLSDRISLLKEKCFVWTSTYMYNYSIFSLIQAKSVGQKYVKVISTKNTGASK